MLYKYKPNYFLATMWEGILFDDKWEFNTTKDWHITAIEQIGAVKVPAKKSIKNKEAY